VKPALFILYLRLLLLSAYADKEDDWMAAPDGFKWPKVSHASFTSDTIDLTPIQKKSVKDICSNGGIVPPPTFHVMKADLHQDGIEQLFLRDIEGSGTGGYCYIILSPTKDGFKQIGDVGGVMTLDEPFDGWLQIECSWRLGGDEQSRTLYRYIDGEYKVVRREIHNFMDNTVKVENE
jgi:hypothetical protein